MLTASINYIKLSQLARGTPSGSYGKSPVFMEINYDLWPCSIAMLSDQRVSNFINPNGVQETVLWLRLVFRIKGYESQSRNNSVLYVKTGDTNFKD